MTNKKVIIIGAGMTGLCAGSYLQMNGYDTEIFELHNLPGGLCTSWERKGYTFDGCLHWLLGSSPSDPFYYLWDELIDMKSIKFIDPMQQFRFVTKDGEELNLYSDLGKLREELLTKAPEDEAFINKFINTAVKLRKFNMPLDKAMEVMSPGDKLKMILKMLPFLPIIMKYNKISIAELGNKCKNKLLREAFTHHELFTQFSFLGFIMSMVFFDKKTAGYPIGGSGPFARLFEKKYNDLGGKIHYSSKVKKINVEDDHAVGIELDNGEQHSADIVVSAGDGFDTIYNMLEGNYTDIKIDARYHGRDKMLTPFPSLVYVSLGIAREIPELPHQVIFQIDEPILVDNERKHTALNTTIYNFDPTLAPVGKTFVNVMFESFGFEYWTNLRKNDRPQYKKEKQLIADRVIQELDKKIGNIKENVEVIDVATPATYIRYTNNWRGSYEGWLPAPGALMSTIKKELPGLNNFYMIGQWVEPGGGLPNTIRSGRNVTQIICKKDNKEFVVKK
jgi:phytoene dehydrogenase-like protein